MCNFSPYYKYLLGPCAAPKVPKTTLRFDDLPERSMELRSSYSLLRFLTTKKKIKSSIGKRHIGQVQEILSMEFSVFFS